MTLPARDLQLQMDQEHLKEKIQEIQVLLDTPEYIELMYHILDPES